VIRILLVLACLGLVLPAQAMRLIGTPPCPMAATMQAMPGAVDLDLDGLPDCCSDAETLAATGQPCKPGADCGATPAAIPLDARPGAFAPAVASAAAVSAGMAPIAVPIARPWRPPARP
jgi:hypothetical protein